ncbi:hypothetical protein Franean1_6732 [Parafrankia sp. EAN1pec]|uniref:hypothetical protein n=1 Tax=Parafrankia sp. (strain EAN1pec) TaxID=298653 RepID=UPI0000544F85|nr:hypothetical protein Franean1_6732 [Frankia sp. EAN1pec]
MRLPRLRHRPARPVGIGGAIDAEDTCVMTSEFANGGSPIRITVFQDPVGGMAVHIDTPVTLRYGGAHLRDLEIYVDDGCVYDGYTASRT